MTEFGHDRKGMVWRIERIPTTLANIVLLGMAVCDAAIE
jgi:hypothetical protein